MVGLRTQRMELTGDGSVRGTGQFQDWPVTAVYRAVGYYGSQLEELPFSPDLGVITNEQGRVLDGSGAHIPGLYATGWIKRGPVGLIGSTKSDATETVRHLVADFAAVDSAPKPGPDAVLQLLKQRNVNHIEWTGWEHLDAHEKALGQAQGRERIKVVDREEMITRSLQP